jgi:hypothetical protein
MWIGEPSIKLTNSEKADFVTSDFTEESFEVRREGFSWKKSSCVIKSFLLTGNKWSSEPIVRRKEKRSDMSELRVCTF